MNRILIVDDTRSWITFHQNIITELYGDLFEITTADNAFDALTLINNNVNNPFNIIITDLQMEDSFDGQLAGEWLIEQIQLITQYAHSKIVIISSMHNIEIIAKNHNVECISKSILVRNKLLLKFMFEKLMPFLNKIN